MSTGELLRVRAAMKPIATVPRALRTVDVATGEPAVAHHQRSDVRRARRPESAEAMVALVLAEAALEKFGGDAVTETRRNRWLPRRAEVPVTPRLVLVGPPGAGKSTVATLLARRWGVEHRDTDRDVEKVAGKPIAEIFIDEGRRSSAPSSESPSHRHTSTPACCRSAGER